MSHANAALTPRAQLRVARLVIDQHVPIVEVAARFQCAEVHDDETPRHRDRGPATGRGLVRRPRDPRRESPVRQRPGVPLAPVA